MWCSVATLDAPRRRTSSNLALKSGQRQWHRHAESWWPTLAADGFELIDDSPSPPTPLKPNQEPPGTPVITALCRYFGGCSPHELHRKLEDPFTRWLAVQLLRTKKLRTSHLKAGRNFAVRFGMLTRKSARRLMAYNGFLRITVQQHFYARYRIHLRHANLPCVCMFGRNNRRTHLPLELLSIM